MKPKDTILIDFQKLLSRMLSAWWLFVLCFGLAMGGAHLFLRYVTFEYSARAVLLIKDAGRSGNISAESILLAETGIGGGKNMDNEIQILKSLTLMEKVAERLKLNIQYFRPGNFKETELYMDSPFLLDSFSLAENNYFGVNYFVELEDYESFLLKESEDDEGLRCFFNIPFETDNGRFTIILNPEVAVVKGLHRMKVSTIETAAMKYKFGLQVERIGHQSASSVLSLSILDPVSQKASDIINVLIEVYNEEEIKDENKVLYNTLFFIDNRVASLVNELDSVEGGIQRYKSSNEIISENASSSMSYTLGEIRSAVQSISSFEIQENLLQSLEKFLLESQSTSEFELIPANLIAESPVLAGLVNKFNELVVQNKQLSRTVSEKHPTRISLEEQMIDIQKLILETIRNLQSSLKIPLEEIERNIQELRSSMGRIPGIEKSLIEKMRTQAVKEKLFLFLLQKREETALAEAVTAAKTRTVDRARAAKFAVYPKPKMVRILSGVLGLLVPFIIIFILSLFETKVDSEEVIKQLTSIPILGRIAQDKGGKNMVVKHGSRSAVNEMFRLLRTNLNFINHNKKNQIIMLTSSISGEGKTFIAINLGMTLALSDKKVVLLGMDLRKPKLASYLGVSQEKGISNYLIGQNEIDDIIHEHEDNSNLFYITCGALAPNPGELILSSRMETLIKELSEKFDYVLIDTPPIGLVSDALQLRGFVDNTLIVVRQNVTRKVMIKHLENMVSKKELEKASIIFNGVKQGKSYYGYGGYYYGKNQGYYVEED